MGRKVKWPPAITVDARTGQARVRHKDTTYYLGRAGSSEAMARYAELLRELVPPTGPSGGLTVEGCVNLWLAHAQERYGGSQEVLEYRYALAPVLELFRHLPASEFDAQKLEEARDEMVRANLCKNVVNRRIVRVRTAWRWLERRGHAPKGSWAGLLALEPLGAADRTARRTEPVRPAEWAVVQAVLPHLTEPAKGLLLLLWHTGARPSELFALEGRQISRSGEVWLFRPERHKCAWRGQERVILFGPEARLLLQSRIDEFGEGLLFPNLRGGAFNMRSFWLAIRRAADKAGVKLYPYQLRHAAKQRAVREFGIDHARALLGQKSMTTADLYAAGQDMKLATEAAKKVGMVCAVP